MTVAVSERYEDLESISMEGEEAFGGGAIVHRARHGFLYHSSSCYSAICNSDRELAEFIAGRAPAVPWCVARFSIRASLPDMPGCRLRVTGQLLIPAAVDKRKSRCDCATFTPLWSSIWTKHCQLSVLRTNWRSAHVL